MIADMISMMSDHGIRVEIIPLQPTIKFSGLSEVLHVLFRILKNPLSSHLHWLNSATKLGNLFCMTSSTTGPNSVKPNRIFRTEHFSSAVVATNTFQELGHATALKKYLLRGAVSVSEFKVGQADLTHEQGDSQFADTSMESTSFQWIKKMEPRELRPGGNSIGIPFGTSGTLATLSATQWTTGLSGSLDHLHQKQAEVPVIFTRENYRLKAKQIVNRSRAREGRTRATGASPFPSCKLRISTEPSGPGRIGKDVLDGKLPTYARGSDDLDEPGTCRNLGELANVGHCCGRLNIGIGIRGNSKLAECRKQKGSSSHFGVACHPQNCQPAYPVTEWNEMQLPGVRCWHQQNLQDPQGQVSTASARLKP
ncbi:hypothetical protein B0H14DRAFT_2580991 [Mycena olivaceomarginata]|nr:hypothetical protein B0H14DRAFT_2580991 [Mycena olivaceomarginata]